MAVPTKPTELGKRYIPLTENILMEYVYVTDRFSGGQTQISEDVITPNFLNTYGDSSVDTYCIAKSGYTNELYFINGSASELRTRNILANTVLPAKKDSTIWVRTEPVNGYYYSAIDSKWSNIDSGESDIIKIPQNQEYIPYDIVRFYFRSGYHSEYDGFIFNIYTKNVSSEYVNLLSAIHTNYDNFKLLTEPMWFADKIYTNYIEYRVPSTAYLTYEGSSTDSMLKNNWSSPYDRKHPDNNTLPWFLSENGYYKNPSIGIDLHAIVGNEEKHGFELLKTQTLTSTLFPNKDSYDKLFAYILPAQNGGDYYTMYAYYEEDPNNPTYGQDSLYDYLSRFDSTFTLAHTISVTEKFTDSDNNSVVDYQAPVTYIQTWEMLTEIKDNNQSPLIKFRPILLHTESLIQDCGAEINYTLRITNNRDNTTIIKTAELQILNPRRFGEHMIAMADNITFSENHIYNRVENTPGINVSTINRPIGSLNNGDTPIIQVKKYVTSSFIDRRNIRVRVSPVTVQNIE